jgi:hypothetical protein
MVKGTTKTGFEFEYNEQRLDDMEFIELAAAVDDNVTLLPKLLNMVLGEEQKKRLYDHLRAEDGRVPTQAVADAMEEIFGAAGDQSKNS